jgi:hypothetical protein
MSSEFLLARMPILCHDAGMAESYATQFARKGGEARAKKLTAQERSESARKAVQTRWAKQKAELEKLTQEITGGTKALLAKTRKRQAAMAKKTKKVK